jgi:diguanylate cyclase (GGDEF)-like protein
MHRFDDVRYRRTDGTELWAMVVSSPLVDPAGAVTGFLGMVTDITDRRAEALRMERWALVDELTGCGTRRHFEVLLEAALSEPAGPCPAVLMVGIDNMNDINEIAGYVTGDAVLREVGRRLRDEVHALGVARGAGDEFLLLIDAEAPVAAMGAAALVRSVLGQLVDIDGHQISVGSSVGIAPPRRSATAGQLLRDAEVALHEAKRLGKGRVIAFDEDMRRAATERVTIEAGLRRALARDELVVHYQPIHRLSSGQLEGCEALVRWNHPERGLLDPAAFVPVAERSDLIVAIGTVVLQEACRQAATWAARTPTGPPLRVNVNIAARQIADPGFLATVRSAISDSGIDPAALCLEITESVVMEQPERAAEVLLAIRELGVAVAFDDFGTGHSSLGALRRFPIDILKIDRSFVAGLGTCPEDRAVVDAIVALAHILGFTIVAEGVESSAQLGQLIEAGCDTGQGFYWSPPVTGPAFAAYSSSSGRGRLRPRRPSRDARRTWSTTPAA